MIRFLFLVVLVLGLQACSFSKDAGDDKNLAMRPVTSSTASLQQKNVLAAVRSGNVTVVEQELQKLEMSEYSFAGLSETPLGMALKADNLEIAKILIERSIGPYNLGSEQAAFNGNVLTLRYESLLKLLNHTRKLQEIKVEASETTVFVLDFYLKAIKEILTKVSEGNVNAALSTIERVGLSCLFVKSQVIQSIQMGEVASSDAVMGFLKKIPCAEELGSSQVQLLYEGELIRQFQSLFAEPVLLAYLSHHPNLKSTMWNIDNSGIYLAPELLIRIAWSADNEFLKEGQCSIHRRIEHAACAYDLDEDEKVQEIVATSGIKRSKFELIKTLDGKVVSLNRFYPRDVRPLLVESDVIYYFTSFYCSGKADFSGVLFPYLAGVKDEDLVGARIPWKAAFLTQPDRIRPLTDEYEEEPEKDVPPHLIWPAGEL
nr:hypothetical protein CKG001_08170 [Bdellovibrio sp. CKG001]